MALKRRLLIVYFIINYFVRCLVSYCYYYYCYYYYCSSRGSGRNLGSDRSTERGDSGLPEKVERTKVGLRLTGVRSALGQAAFCLRGSGPPRRAWRTRSHPGRRLGRLRPKLVGHGCQRVPVTLPARDVRFEPAHSAVSVMTPGVNASLPRGCRDADDGCRWTAETDAQPVSMPKALATMGVVARVITPPHPEVTAFGDGPAPGGTNPVMMNTNPKNAEGRDQDESSLQIPQINVGGTSMSRSGSAASLASFASNASAFSGMTAEDMRGCEASRLKAIELRKAEADLISLIEKELQEMQKACEIQTNASKTLKNGVKNIMGWVHDMKTTHSEADEFEQTHLRGMRFMEEGRQARKKITRRIQGKLIRQAILDRQENKRARSKTPTPEKKPAKRKKKKEENKNRREKHGERKTATPTPPAKVGIDSEGSKRRVRQPAEGVLVKVAQGQTYADVLGRIRKEVNPDTSNTRVLAVKRTTKGDILLKIGRESNRQAFVSDLAKITEGLAVVNADRRVTIEIRDLDALTEVPEVREAIDRVLGAPNDDRKISILRPNRVGQRMALVTTDTTAAISLLNMGHIRVGYMSCRIRRRLEVPKCFRCQGYGHLSRECQGPDRSKLCHRCGEQGHTMANCAKEKHCYLCEERKLEKHDHVAGSGDCSVFRQALESAKRKEHATRKT